MYGVNNQFNHFYLHSNEKVLDGIHSYEKIIQQDKDTVVLIVHSIIFNFIQTKKYFMEHKVMRTFFIKTMTLGG